MSEINLGKVMLSWQGEYDNAKTYTRLDAVSYNGSSYISLNGSVGVLPTNAEYWGKLAQAGKDGSAATAQTPDLSQIKSDVASNSTAVASAASTANAASAAASQANQAVQAIDLSPLERNITDNSTAASSAYALASSAMSEAQAGGAPARTLQGRSAQGGRRAGHARFHRLASSLPRSRPGHPRAGRDHRGTPEHPAPGRQDRAGRTARVRLVPQGLAGLCRAAAAEDRGRHGRRPYL